MNTEQPPASSLASDHEETLRNGKIRPPETPAIPSAFSSNGSIPAAAVENSSTLDAPIAGHPDLSRLTTPEAKVFRAVCYFHERNIKPQLRQIAARADIAYGSVSNALKECAKKGVLWNAGVMGAPDFQPVSSKGSQPEIAPAPARASKEDADDEPPVPADLSDRQREVLVFMSRNDFKDKLVAVPGIAPLDLANILVRLRGLGLAALDPGGWVLRPEGLRLAREISGDPAPPPPLDAALASLGRRRVGDARDEDADEEETV